ncbi:ketopantoate reductase family protein [Seohaeicola zhoushanensis]|uniref:2-dehydropantoate 2-reductase n=1 Tax=Seohaeicola zhoushanensis TaxID=1569283 RepID=A0A8J3GZX8_9RHOB|nr:2-dehydropantoate 2-reductase [Seohaeicola zhoushanensis]GHF64170.1 2-dehydropantoate 2-reductase [Seohaeicola zhoushanensis]
MRVVVVGIGAVGGTIAAALSLAGVEVAGIARGAQLAAIRANGLHLRTPDGAHFAHFPCYADPAEAGLRPDDLVVLTVKSQDSAAALAQLRAAGMTDQPLFCAQNGVANEALAARVLPNVHGMTVMLPADYTTPGEVITYGGPRWGIFDLGRWPSGTDQADAALAEALNRANFAAFPSGEVMQSKYGKLLLNLHNIVDAAIGRGALFKKIQPLLTAEGEAVLRAAGIAWQDVGIDDPRRESLMRFAKVTGANRAGSSTLQSFARGAGSVETDFLNGEIVMLGAQHGVPTPVNGWFCRLADRMLREGIAPGAIDPTEVERALGL